MTPEQEHREAVFSAFADEHERVRCYLADDDCRGRLQAAHIIAAKVIRRRYAEATLRSEIHGERRPILEADLDDLIADGRNGVPLCELHHNRYEGPVLHVTPPEAFWGFVADFDLWHITDNARTAA